VEGSAPACSACAAELASDSHKSGEVVPGEVSVTGDSPSFIAQVSDEDFESFLSEHSGTVLVDFYADWCGPCKIKGAILEDMASSVENATIVKVNVDDSPQLAQRFEITGIPALLVFRDGKLVDRNVGVADAEQISALISE